MRWMIGLAGFGRGERPAVGTTAEGVSSGVLPAGLLGLFPRRCSDAKRKSPNRLWLFRGGVNAAGTQQG